MRHILQTFNLLLIISFARMSEIKRGSCQQENKGWLMSKLIYYIRVTKNKITSLLSHSKLSYIVL